jgi:hypothetical protein
VAAVASNNRVIGGDKVDKALGDILAKLQRGKAVRVGFLAGATYPAKPGKGDALPVAQVAFWNEFGTTRTPARPFMRNTINNPANQKKWAAGVARGLREYGWDSAKAFAVLGNVVRDDIVSAIAQWPADNAPATVANKGFNKGLVHTGDMQRHVDYEVIKK